MKIIIDSIDRENRVVRLKSVSDEEYAAMEPKLEVPAGGLSFFSMETPDLYRVKVEIT